MSPSPMRLAFSLADQSLHDTKSVGILNVSLGLLRALTQLERAPALTVLSNSSLDERLGELPALRRQRHDEALGGGLRRMLWDQLGVYAVAERAGADWLFLPKGYASFLRRPGTRLAVYVHDAMIEHYGSQRLAGLRRTELAYFRGCLLSTLRTADLLFLNTEFTRAELEKLARANGLELPPHRVVGYGCERPTLRSPVRDLILVLVSRLPHKRSASTLAALRRWKPTPGFRVCLVGAVPPGVSLEPSWHPSPRLEESEYRLLFSRARAIVYSSEYEGFGLPPVEALLGGAAPVYSDLPVTREVMEGRGFPFDNDDPASLARQLDAALSCPQETLDAWGEALAAKYRWSRVAEQVVDALHRTPGRA